MPVRFPAQGRAPLQDPFDLWLRRSLRENWGDVAEESVPEDLLRLFSDDRVEWESMKARWLRASPPSPGPDASQ